MSKQPLQEWALSAGADPEIWTAWNHAVLEFEYDALYIRVLAEGILTIEADDDMVDVTLPTPAAAIRAAQAFIKELKS